MVQHNIVLFLDVDECSLNNGGCTQICTDTTGSFACNCLDGFQLVNGSSCIGKPQGSSDFVCIVLQFDTAKIYQ